MTPDIRTPKKVTDQLLVEQLATELMVYDQRRKKAFCLNQPAAYVWQHCDGKTTAKEMAAGLGQLLGKPADEKLVQYALETLHRDGLLEEASFVPLVPVEMTRRSLMQKFGVTAAMSLPIVTGLMVATPKAHASSRRSQPPHHFF